MKKIKYKEIKEILRKNSLEVKSKISDNEIFFSLKTILNSSATDLTFFSNIRYIKDLSKIKAKACLIEEKFINYFESIDTLNSKPGKKIAYSNIGASLLGYSLCKISKMKFEDMLQQYVCIPFKMNSTTTNRSIIENKLVRG